MVNHTTCVDLQSETNGKLNYEIIFKQSLIVKKVEKNRILRFPSFVMQNTKETNECLLIMSIYFLKFCSIILIEAIVYVLSFQKRRNRHL